MGVQRFGELVARLDIPRAILSARLHALEAEGLVERRPYSATREDFHLTQAGRDLWPAVYALTSWGERYRCAGGGARRLWLHADCGTELDGAGDCPRPAASRRRPRTSRPGPARSGTTASAWRCAHRTAY